MSSSKSKLRSLIPNNPLIRGMISYGISWPASSVTQEYLEYGKTLRNADWRRAGRFGFFGCFCMSPVVHLWLQFSNRFFIRNDLSTALKRAALEQVTYGPFISSYFFFGFSILEGHSIEDSIEEVKFKFWPTFKMGFFFWPFVRTVNYYWIPARKRIIFLSFFSFIWTTYMAHMKAVNVPHGSR